MLTGSGFGVAAATNSARIRANADAESILAGDASAMLERVTAREEVVEIASAPAELSLELLAEALAARAEDGVPVRLAVTRSEQHRFSCEIGVVSGLPTDHRARIAPLLSFRRRSCERTATFTTVLIVPTGIGCAVGGHAGDATAAARLFAAVSDRLITHPNVVNASDVNELPDEALYVEGSVLTRFLLGTVALAQPRSNRVLAVVDAHEDEHFTAVAVNSVSAARSSFGLTCPEVVLLDPPLPVRSVWAPSGRATGVVEELERLLEILDERRGRYDAVALSTKIDVPHSYHLDYYLAGGEMVNPWGGVEALLTHVVSSIYDVPAAHSPMFESREIAALDPGIVDPRMAAEVISTGFFISVLKGLHRSPTIVGATTPPDANALAVEDVSCLVIPDGVLGLPTLAALEQGIPVIAVRENTNIMENDLTALPWHEGQLLVVDNYWEAAGVTAALRAGLDPTSVRRPIAATAVSVAATAGA